MLLNRVFFFSLTTFSIVVHSSVACENSVCVSFLYGISHTSLCNEKITVRVYNVNSSAEYHRAVDPEILAC